MSRALYQHTCSVCSKSYTKEESWIDPKLFKNPKEAYKTVTFWCPLCKEGQAIKFRMLPNTQLEVAEILNYKEVCSELSILYYGHFDEDDSEEEMPALNEKKAFSLFDLD